MKRQSKRDTMIANEKAHAHYAAMSGKPPMIEYDIPAKRARRETPVNTTPKEHEEQAAVVSWFFHYAKTRGLDHRQLVAIPNGQALLKFANNPNAFMWYLKAEGLRPGMLDLCLFHAVQGYHALLVEMKRSTGGVVSDDQKAMADVMDKAGYRCYVCAGADGAIEVIKRYCEG